ncbi:hypothetical protein DXG01_005701, partial [Tephrocybe rancida]
RPQDEIDKAICNAPIPLSSKVKTPKPTPVVPSAPQAASPKLPLIPDINMHGPNIQKKLNPEAPQAVKNPPPKNVTPPQAKAGPSYHITSLLQDSINTDKLQSQILSTPITVTIGELIGTSVELQRRFVNLTKM